MAANRKATHTCPTPPWCKKNITPSIPLSCQEAIFRFNGNVMNTGLITNLPGGCCVEVLCLVDKMGMHPCYVGDLPLAITPRRYVVVDEFGSLQTRTNLNYYTSEAVAKIRCRLLGKEVPAGSHARIMITEANEARLFIRKVSESPFVL